MQSHFVYYYHVYFDHSNDLADLTRLCNHFILSFTSEIILDTILELFLSSSTFWLTLAYVFFIDKVDFLANYYTCPFYIMTFYFSMTRPGSNTTPKPSPSTSAAVRKSISIRGRGRGRGTSNVSKSRVKKNADRYLKEHTARAAERSMVSNLTFLSCLF